MPLQLTDPDDEFSDLLSRCSMGDSEAWHFFMHEFHPLISAVAGRSAPGHADDIIQEVYLTIVKDHFKLLRKFDSESRPAFLVYLKRIAENTAKNFLRKHRIQTVELGEALNELADERKNAEAVLLIEADMETLRSAIRSLRKDYRNVVELLLKGYRHREIAEILEIPLKTSLTWAHRAVADLRKKLKIEIISDHEHILS